MFDLMISSIYKEDVDYLDMKYIVNNFFINGGVKLENVLRWAESKAHIWVTISLIYYRFIVRFTIGFEFLFVVSTHSLDPCLWGSPIIPPLVHQPAYLSI